MPGMRLQGARLKHVKSIKKQTAGAVCSFCEFVSLVTLKSHLSIEGAMPPKIKGFDFAATPLDRRNLYTRP